VLSGKLCGWIWSHTMYSRRDARDQ